ncbi:aldehyde dehydrogenase family protein [Actinomadura scrupuli]|uniref:aldehyde dehydrogenase family protein n=1 Tax=Actinomadura scrupuli TaxID=559629 RepID=UPI003D98998F
MTSGRRQDTLDSRSPQDPADVVVTVPASSPEQVAGCVERARSAAGAWRRSPAAERGDALTRLAAGVDAAAGELAGLIVREVGKPAAEAAAEVGRAAAILRYYAGQALGAEGDVLPAPDGRSLLHTRRRPHGVAGLVTPWNFPLAIPVWKLAPALAFGNTVVLKPAEESPAVALRLAELAREVLPEDVLRVVTGDATTGAALVDLADVVSFTGSVRAGRAVREAAARRGVPVQCEMGGQNPSLVLPDADLGAAARTIAAAAMGYAGQKCTATSRVIVVGDAEGFAERLAAAVGDLAVGDPADPAVAVGPVIDQGARDRVVGAVESARAAGARVVTGGSPLESPGWFVGPAVLTGLPPGHELSREEVFGPVCAVIPAADAGEAVRIANDVRYGLVAAVFTRDLGAALDAVDLLDAGMIRINAATTGVDYHAPFGGSKESGSGPREQGTAARLFYTESRTITISPP